MALDLHKVANSLSAMAGDLTISGASRAEKLCQALELFSSSSDISALKEKIATSKTSWLVAEIGEGLKGKYLPIDEPEDFTVLATDGSQIDVDRHRARVVPDKYHTVAPGTVKRKCHTG